MQYWSIRPWIYRRDNVAVIVYLLDLLIKKKNQFYSEKCKKASRKFPVYLPVRCRCLNFQILILNNLKAALHYVQYFYFFLETK